MRHARVLLGILAVVAFALPAFGQQPKPGQGSSADDDLLRQLRAKPLDEADRELFGPAGPSSKKPEPGAKTPDSKPGEDLPSRLRRELGSAGVSENDDPLLSIARPMREVESLLRDRKPATSPQEVVRTQQVQKQIVADLDALIKQARKSASQCKGSGQASPQTPSPREAFPQPKPPSGPAPGTSNQNPAPITNPDRKPGSGESKPPEAAETRTPIDRMKDVWGVLPDAQRNQMLELPIDEFLPEYRPMIIDYYKRLSEGQQRRPGGEKP
jgi:hypothetical protein